MAKVTSKLQVTVPKALADRYRIRPGDDIEWQAAGDAIRVVPPRRPPAAGVAAQLKLFDQATARQQARQSTGAPPRADARDWTREELYRRGRAR